MRGSTLLESIVAMVVLGICISIAVQTYANILKSENGRLRLKAGLFLEQVASSSKKERSFLDEEIRTESFLVRKTVAVYPPAPGLVLLKLVATDPDNRKLAERNELIPAE
jgi:prepilin-type N-terminal cleavage/methylation domain-containing protein